MKKHLIRNRGLSDFKRYMTSDKMPNYVHRYCRRLDDLGWMIFHAKMIVPFIIIIDVEDLIYLLKWILKDDSDDFVYALYLHHEMGAEGRSYINVENLEMLHKRYYDLFLSNFHYDEDCDDWLEKNSNDPYF